MKRANKYVNSDAPLRYAALGNRLHESLCNLITEVLLKWKHMKVCVDTATLNILSKVKQLIQCFVIAENDKVILVLINGLDYGFHLISLNLLKKHHQTLHVRPEKMLASIAT